MMLPHLILFFDERHTYSLYLSLIPIFSPLFISLAVHTHTHTHTGCESCRFGLSTTFTHYPSRHFALSLDTCIIIIIPQYESCTYSPSCGIFTNLYLCRTISVCGTAVLLWSGYYYFLASSHDDVGRLCHRTPCLAVFLLTRCHPHGECNKQYY